MNIQTLSLKWDRRSYLSALFLEALACDAA